MKLDRYMLTTKRSLVCLKEFRGKDENYPLYPQLSTHSGSDTAVDYYPMPGPLHE